MCTATFRVPQGSTLGPLNHNLTHNSNSRFLQETKKFPVSNKTINKNVLKINKQKHLQFNFIKTEFPKEICILHKMNGQLPNHL